MVVVKELCKAYGELQAVDRVSFEVNRGDILGFLGPNGAGKTTTMRMLTGFLKPTAGTVSVGGHDIVEAPVAAQRLIGYLPENGPLYPEMTVKEFLNFAAQMRGMDWLQAERALRRAKDICELETVWVQTIDTLSKGYRQRVGLAQAILHDPACLIMDEPTDGLDPNQKRTVRRLIREMAQEKAIILSTHILEEVEALCNRVILIHHGKILVDEPLPALRARHPRDKAVWLELDGVDDAQVSRELERLGEIVTLSRTPEGWLLQGERSGLLETMGQIARDKSWKVKRLEKAPAPLEDVFYALTHGENAQ